jgi:hypothetical protein
MTLLTDRQAFTGPLAGDDRLAPATPPDAGSLGLRLLAWAFAFFNSMRLLSYLPTLWAIHSQGDASQHSLLTWLTWTGANATMAAWVYQQNRRRFNRAIAVQACSAVMCLATTALILAYRL